MTEVKLINIQRLLEAAEYLERRERGEYKFVHWVHEPLYVVVVVALFYNTEVFFWGGLFMFAWKSVQNPTKKNPLFPSTECEHGYASTFPSNQNTNYQRQRQKFRNKKFGSNHNR